MNYEQLLTAADQEGLLVKEQPLTGHDGLIRGSRIAIRKDIETQAEKSCVLAEEIGHYRTSSGTLIYQKQQKLLLILMVQLLTLLIKNSKRNGRNT